MRAVAMMNRPANNDVMLASLFFLICMIVLKILQLIYTLLVIVVMVNCKGERQRCKGLV